MSKETSIYEYLQFEIISGALNKTDLSFFRKVCRWYSEKFHTPLHIVMEGNVMQWDEILLHYYESHIEDIPYNDLYDRACQEYIPEFAEQYEKENQEYADALVAEQKRSLERKKKKTEKLQPSTTLKEPTKKDLPPTMNLNFEEPEDIS